MSNQKTGAFGYSAPLFAFSLLFLMWLLASGHYTPLLIGFGALSCAGVVALCCRMRIIDRESFPYHMVWRMLRYSPWWAREVAKANIDVAKRILSPRMPLSPKVFEVPTTQRSDLGRVLYANSITTTPGTVSIEAEGNEITVHAIATDVADAILTGEMDRQVTRMEGSG